MSRQKPLNVFIGFDATGDNHDLRRILSPVVEKLFQVVPTNIYRYSSASALDSFLFKHNFFVVTPPVITAEHLVSFLDAAILVYPLPEKSVYPAILSEALLQEVPVLLYKEDKWSISSEWTVETTMSRQQLRDLFSMYDVVEAQAYSG